MSLFSFGNIAKPVTVLVEKASEAVAGAFRPAQIRRVGRAQTEVNTERIREEAKAEADAAKIRAAGEIEIERMHRSEFSRTDQDIAKSLNVFTQTDLIDQAALREIEFQKQGDVESDIERWCAIAETLEGVDDERAACVWFSIGNQYVQASKYEAAVSAYDKSIRLCTESDSAYSNRGTAKAELGRHEEAITDYDTAIGLNPESAVAYLNRGTEKVQLGWYEEAIGDYDTAIRLNPESAVAYNNRGNAKMELGRHEEAIEDCDAAVRLNPELAQAYNNRGTAKFRLGEYRDAIVNYDEVIRLNSGNAETYNNRGCAKHFLREYIGAMMDYDEAIRLDFEYAEA